jgi:hypothetical protein
MYGGPPDTGIADATPDVMDSASAALYGAPPDP